MNDIIKGIEIKIKELDRHKSDYWKGVKDGYSSALNFIRSHNQKPEISIQRVRKKYDTSTKEYELQVRQYRFDKYERKYNGDSYSGSQWIHQKYYKTLQGAQDAIKHFRSYKSPYYDYPAMGNPENEKKYPHIKPTITAIRYRIIKREFYA